MKSLHRTVSTYSILLLLTVFSMNSAFGQVYHPETGELIPAPADTLKKSPVSPAFDPETGQLLMPKATPQVTPSPNSLKVTQATDLGLNPCLQAKLDAKAEASLLWYAGGLVYFVGPPAFFLAAPKPNPKNMTYQVDLENQLYSECYTLESYKERLKRMSLGCVGYVVFAILMFD